MTHVITSLCLRDGGCIPTCPVACIVPGDPQDEWPTFYIDPNVCIDCIKCVEACPVGAIFSIYDVPSNYIAYGGEVLVAPTGTPGFTESHDTFDFEGNPVYLPATRKLEAGEIINLTADIQVNKEFFNSGPGYLAADL